MPTGFPYGGLSVHTIHEVIRRARIDRDSPLPYYYQIAQVLREAIEDVGADEAAQQQEEVALPSEPTLSELFGVTRGTVRHALAILQREGLLYREKGRGTFIKRRRVELDLTHLCSITEHMRSREWEPTYRVLRVQQLLPRPKVQQGLHLEPDVPVWEIRRLRLASREPVSFEWSYIPVRLAEGLDRQDLTQSLYDILKDRYGLELKTADQTIRTRLADAEEAQLLGVEAGAPIFVITGTISDSHGLPVEHSRSLWRGDRYDLQVRLVSRD